jgi:hypothetical protein
MGWYKIYARIYNGNMVNANQSAYIYFGRLVEPSVSPSGYWGGF